MNKNICYHLFAQLKFFQTFTFVFSSKNECMDKMRKNVRHIAKTKYMA